MGREREKVGKCGGIAKEERIWGKVNIFESFFEFPTKNQKIYD